MPPTQTRAQRQADATIAELDQAVAWLFGTKGNKNPWAHFEALKRQIHEVMCRDEESPRIDGYRSRHGSSDGGGNSDATPVEAAALRLVDGRQPVDVVHRATIRFVDVARTMRDAAVQGENALRTVPRPGAPTEAARLCSWCQAEPGDRETDVNGALKGARFLGLECIGFVERQGSARVGRHGPRLPTPAEIEQRRTGKAPKARVNPKDIPFRWRDGTTTGINQPPPAA
jgi:hypothetical protein